MCTQVLCFGKEMSCSKYSRRVGGVSVCWTDFNLSQNVQEVFSSNRESSLWATRDFIRRPWWEDWDKFLVSAETQLKKKAQLIKTESNKWIS